MTTKRPISFFLSSTGRKLSFVFITGSTIAITAAKFLPHTILIEQYKNTVHYYNNSKPAELSSELHSRFKKCLDMLELPEMHKKLVTPFSIYGYDLFHAGSTASRFGAIVGIPVNFNYKSIEDIKAENLQVNMKPVNWNSESGKKFADSLILPEKLQEFAMCREILMCDTYKVVLDAIYPFISIYFAYTSSSYLNKRLNLYQAPTGIRGVLYTIIGTFALGMYFLMNDATEVHYETKVDERLSKLGPEYVETGIEFYKKVLQRNQAFRELMGNEGERKYTKLGNENHGIRYPRIPLMHRKQYFEDKFKEITEEMIETQ